MADREQPEKMEVDAPKEVESEVKSKLESPEETEAKEKKDKVRYQLIRTILQIYNLHMSIL